jgi:hypothetical protein
MKDLAFEPRPETIGIQDGGGDRRHIRIAIRIGVVFGLSGERRSKDHDREKTDEGEPPERHRA